MPGEVDAEDASVARASSAFAGPSPRVAPAPGEAPAPSSGAASIAPGETLACSICLEPCALGGPHQVCALACGHCFGHRCISSWLDRHKRGNGGKCPQCNVRAKAADVRKLFVPTFAAFVDTAELDDSRADLARERARRVEADANYSRVSKCAKKLEADLAEATRALEDARAEAKRAKYDAQKARREANRDADAAANAGPNAANAGPNERPDRENPHSNPHSNPAKRAKPAAGTVKPRGVKSVLEMFDPNRGEGISGKSDDDEEKRRRERRRAHFERAHRGRYVPRVAVPVRAETRAEGIQSGEGRGIIRRGFAMDVNGVVACVAERRGDGAVGVSKISLRAPESRAFVACASSSRAGIADIRLSDGGDSGLANRGRGSTLALVADRFDPRNQGGGGRMHLLDLSRDARAASWLLPEKATCCSWGGWGVGAPVGAPLDESFLAAGVREAPSRSSASSAEGDPSADANLVTVGMEDGSVAMYDLRNTGACVSRIKTPRRIVTNGHPHPETVLPRSGIHAAYPLSARLGGGVLFADEGGPWRFVPGRVEAGSAREGGVVEGADENAFGRVLDLGWSRERHPHAGCCAMAWAPGSRVYAVINSGDGRQDLMLFGDVDGGADENHHLTAPPERKHAGYGRYGRSNGNLVNGPGALALTRGREDFPSAVALGGTGAGTGRESGSALCDSPGTTVFGLTDPLTDPRGARESFVTQDGGRVVNVVRNWCERRGAGGVDVLATLSADTLQVCSWHEMGC